MKKWWRLISFACLCLLQIAVVLQSVAGNERTLSKGQPYKFKLRPIDPYDAFAGRYINLSFEVENQVKLSDLPDPLLTRKQRDYYAVLGRDDDGFAIITGISSLPPAAGDYVRMKVRLFYSDLWVRLPFNRYYLEEGQAPAAEKAYWMLVEKHLEEQAYALVMVKSGRGVIKDLYLRGLPLGEYLRRHGTGTAGAGGE